MDETRRQRARRGSITARYLLAMPAELAARVEAGAEREGISVAEWIRRACRDRALRQARRGSR